MHPPEIIVFDSLHACSYLPGRTARLPYRHPMAALTPQQFDQRLSEGDRRSGVYLYRTKCPTCRACQPIRLDLETFKPNATQRRTERQGNSLLVTKISPPKIDTTRVELFNQHREERGLTSGDSALDEYSYAEFLTDTCCETLEFSYWHESRLVAIAIADAGQTSLSAVYCFYDPTFQLLSLGTYSVLRHVQFCRDTDRRYLYLGFYIAESPHMSYKSRFHPNQRLIDGNWQDFS